MRRKKKTADINQQPGANGYGSMPGANGYGGMPGANGYGSMPGANGYGGMPGANGYSGIPGANGYSGGIQLPPQDREVIRPDLIGMWTAAIACAIGTLIGMILYMLPGLPSVLKIGLLVLLAAGSPLCAVYLYAKIRPKRQQANRAGAPLLACALAVLFGLGCLMQFLYNLTAEVKELPIDDYLFVIDDSGSMESSDPNNARMSSLRTILGDIGEDKRIGLVCFTAEITAEIPLNYATADQKDTFSGASRYLNSYGGTDIQRAVLHALDMDGMSDSSRSCMMVLLTDGYSQSFVFAGQLAEACLQKNVVITTIGLGESADSALLKQLASMTGGMYYDVNDLDQLSMIYRQVNRVDSSRDLLGLRPGAAHGSVGLAILRIVSWILFGVVEGIAAMLLLPKTPKQNLLGLGCAAGGVCAGIILELLNLLWIDFILLQGVFVLLYGVLILYYRKRIPAQTNGFVMPGGGIGYGWTTNTAHVINPEEKKPPTSGTFQ